MPSCLRVLRPRKKKSSDDSLPPRPGSSSSSPTPPHEVEMRCNSIESWSSLLESDNLDNAGKDVTESQEWMADLSQLFIGNRFASGAHSRIYRGIYKQRAVAVKMVRIPDRDKEIRSHLEAQFSSEVALLSHLYHLNIVQFIEACKKPPLYCIIMEYMSQGTLRMYLHKKEPYSLSTETILRLALDISRGMQYLHSQESRASKGNAGTYRWMAPEMIKERPYTRKVDVYSFGIVLWELTTALVPFQGMTPVQAAFAVSEKNARPPLADNCSPVLANLIKRCWDQNPAKRPDFSYIVSVLEKYDQCLKDGNPHLPNVGLSARNVLLDRFKSCMPVASSIPVHA